MIARVTTIAELLPDRPALAELCCNMLGRTATVDDFSKQFLADFRDHLAALGYPVSTQTRYTHRLRLAWREAHEAGHTEANPGAKRTWVSNRRPKPPEAIPKVVRDEAPRLLIPCSPTMAVQDYLPHFFRTHYKGKSIDCRRTYRNAVARLREFLKAEPMLTDLRHEKFARWVKWCKGRGLTRATWKTNVGRLRTVWRAAHEDGLAADAPPDIHSWDSGLPRHKPVRVERQPVPVEMMPTILKPGEKPADPETYIAYYTLERGIGKSAQRNLRHRLNQFATAIGHPVTWEDFQPMTVNAALAKELARGLSPETVRGMRCGILSLWRAAYEAEILDHQPGRIRKIKITAKLPQCWTMAQLATLSRAIDDLKGHMRSAPSVSRRDFWRAFVSLGYYTGLRLGDLMRLNWQQHIGDDGSLNIVMSKTGDLLSTRLPDDCLARLEPLRAAGTPLVFGDLLSKSNTQLFFRRILKAAGLPGSVKWLRRTGATHLEAIHRGAAKDHLGHRTHGLAYKNYVDPRIVQLEKPLPPRLELEGGSP